MTDLFNKKLIILEMANNHMGDVSHGLDIINAFHGVVENYKEFTFAFKFQYRDLDTFIHPDYKDRMDIKYVKRFSETRLSEEEFIRLIERAKSLGFKVICTPFDEISVDKIVKHGYDAIKIGSCSINDWPLLTKVAEAGLPVIASTAGIDLYEVKKVHNFFRHRKIEHAIMHCVAKYPSEPQDLNVSRLQKIQSMFPKLKHVGFSTHEDPNIYSSVFMAVACGANIFEKHVALPSIKHPNAVNSYSVRPPQLECWLNALREACAMYESSEANIKEEQDSLNSLKRGVFVNRDVDAGERLFEKDFFYAIPAEDEQYYSNDVSKYCSFTATSSLKANSAIKHNTVKRYDHRSYVLSAVQVVQELVEKSGIVIPENTKIELSHHYGLYQFFMYGMAMFTIINREYCKKYLVLLPCQKHPEQYHLKKEEAFYIIWGDVDITLNDVTKTYTKGDIVVVEPGVKHKMETASGAVIEELSTTHDSSDSYYSVEEINKNKNRKTFVTYWREASEEN
ncbi:MAG: N-acetylneuraminate synthase family protein [Paludibacteraceae bacterium]|nr:N-acetylneuraminate synthase family protein [Paludibacteraceae bacterium]